MGGWALLPARRIPKAIGGFLRHDSPQQFCMLVFTEFRRRSASRVGRFDRCAKRAAASIYKYKTIYAFAYGANPPFFRLCD